MMILRLTICLLLLIVHAEAEMVKINFSTSKSVSTEVMQKYNTHYGLLNKRDGVYYYWGALDESDITAFTKEVPATIIGAFRKNGLQVGVTKQLSTLAKYDSGGAQLSPDKYSNVGTAKHVFNKAEYLKSMKDVKTYNKEGIELSSKVPTKLHETHNIFGWETAQFPEDKK